MSVIRDESGTTLIELMVALMTGLVIISALTMVILTTLHGTNRISARVHATQRARLAVTQLMEELHSACVMPEIAPIKEGSEGNKLRFVHQTGSAVSPTPVLSEIVYNAGTLTQSDFASTGGTSPNWTFSKTASSKKTLLTDVAPMPPNTSIFSYYAYSGGAISTTPQTTPLSEVDALLTVQVRAAISAAPEHMPVADAGAEASIQNATTLRLTPPSFNEGSPARPCQ